MLRKIFVGFIAWAILFFATNMVNTIVFGVGTGIYNVVALVLFIGMIFPAKKIADWYLGNKELSSAGSALANKVTDKVEDGVARATGFGAPANRVAESEPELESEPVAAPERNEKPVEVEQPFSELIQDAIDLSKDPDFISQYDTERARYGRYTELGRIDNLYKEDQIVRFMAGAMAFGPYLCTLSYGWSGLSIMAFTDEMFMLEDVEDYFEQYGSYGGNAIIQTLYGVNKDGMWQEYSVASTVNTLGELYLDYDQIAQFLRTNLTAYGVDVYWIRHYLETMDDGRAYKFPDL